MNLSTARSAERAKEVGIRKSIGAERRQLALQFIGESVLLSFIALILGVLIAKFLLPYVNNLSQRELELPIFSNISLMLIIIAGTIAVGLISGIYPAAYLSSFQPVKVLKGRMQAGNNKASLRNVLVVVQFSGAIFLIIATVFAVRQLSFMQKKDPGFNKDQVMILPLNNKSNEKYSTLKKELSASTLITGITGAQQGLGNNLHQTGVVFHGDGPAREMTSSQVIVDPDYLKVYKIPLVAGRNFTNDYAADNA